MPTILFLNDTQVFPDSSQNIKLTRENPYFTESESYTLEVTLPTDIMQNRQLFRNLQRMDCSKQPPSYTCRLLVDNHTVLCGSARVTQVTEKQVKVQLLGGNSEVRFLSSQNNDYIDELPLGTREAFDEFNLAFYSDISTELPYSKSYVYNETSGQLIDSLSACHPQLVGVMRLVIQQYGYTMANCFLDEEPWNKLYIASALHTLDVAHKLPHWTVKEFITEFCHFFNVTPVVDQMAKTVTFTSNIRFYGNAQTETIEPISEYTADINGDDDSSSIQSMANANIVFARSSSPCHDYDCLDEGVRSQAEKAEYTSQALLRQAWEEMEPAQRRRLLFMSPGIKMMSWVYTRGNSEYERLVFADLLAPLRRNSAEEIELKICPVALGQEEPLGSNSWGMLAVPSLESPTADEHPYQWLEEDNTVERQTLQEQVSEGATSQSSKEDLMQVFFDDDRFVGYGSPQVAMKCGFVSPGYKNWGILQSQRTWSLALNQPGADAFSFDVTYLGQLHQNTFSFNMKARHTFKFLAERMPDPTRVYIIRGKRYGCEKIEANVNEDGFVRLMTGYFYEMLQQ